MEELRSEIEKLKERVAKLEAAQSPETIARSIEEICDRFTVPKPAPASL